MLDGPTAAVIVSAVLGTAATVVVALLKFGPTRQPPVYQATSQELLEYRVRILEADSALLSARMHWSVNVLIKIAEKLEIELDPAPQRPLPKAQ